MSEPVEWGVRDTPLTSRPVPITDPAIAYPPDYGPPPRQPPRSRTGLYFGLAAISLILLAGVVVGGYVLLGRTGTSLPGRPATFTVSGTMQITGGCAGLGYGDIRAGTQVVITDEHQTTLAVGELEADGSCQWSFRIDKVAAGHSFYGVTISHRGTVQYTEAQLRQGVHLSMGD
jgi:hypothetical protein